MFFEKVLINGERVNKNKVDMIINEAVDNIILCGFNSLPELEKIVKVNGRNDDYLIDNILYKLQYTYSNNIDKESNKAMNEKISAVNIGLMIDTQMIILELIQRRVNSFIENANNSSEYIEDMDEELSESLEDEDEILTLGDECDEDVESINKEIFSRMMNAGKDKVKSSLVFPAKTNA